MLGDVSTMSSFFWNHILTPWIMAPETGPRKLTQQSAANLTQVASAGVSAPDAVWRMKGNAYIFT